MKDPIQVLLVEDNPEYSEVIALALDEELDIELIARFGTAEKALRSLDAETADRVSPDVLLLDLRLPGKDGLEAMPEFIASLPDAKILILTQSNAEQDVLRAISLGAAGYLLKSATVDEITAGIRDVMRGGAPIEASVAKFLLNSLRSHPPQAQLQDLLTEREFEILTLLAEGLLKKQIAQRLKIRYTTVDTHVGHIYHKLDARNAPGAISKAYQRGILPRAR